MDVREKLVELPIEDALLVLREEHRQRTDSYTTYLAHGGKGDPAEEVSLDALAMAISALEKTKWISVDDRLPEPEQDVILCTSEIETYGRHSEKKKIYRNIFMGYFDGDEWLTSYCYGCEYIFRMNEKYPNETIEVTHWMPLPEPPEEGTV